MTAENNFNIKPLTNISHITPANPSGEQPDRKNRRFKPKPSDQPVQESQIADDDGNDMQHVIDYCA